MVILFKRDIEIGGGIDSRKKEKKNINNNNKK